jgi:hypothetical protein
MRVLNWESVTPDRWTPEGTRLPSRPRNIPLPLTLELEWLQLANFPRGLGHLARQSEPYSKMIIALHISGHWVQEW